MDVRDGAGEHDALDRSTDGLLARPRRPLPCSSSSIIVLRANFRAGRVEGSYVVAGRRKESISRYFWGIFGSWKCTINPINGLWTVETEKNEKTRKRKH